MTSFAGVILLLCFIAGTLAATSDCAVAASVARRAGSWSQTDGVYQIFDISITNTGRCNFAKVVVNLTFSDNSSIVNSWNYNPLTGEVFNFGYLAAGQSFRAAGIIVKGAQLPALPTIKSATSICDMICVGTPAPTSPPPTPTPTSAPSGSPTGAPTNTPTKTPDTQCQLTVTQARRTANGGSWVIDGFSYQIYDLEFTNSGSKVLLTAELSEGLSVGYPISWWGLEKVCCDQVQSAISYNVSLFHPFYVGASLSAGYILKYNSSLTLADPTFPNPIVQTPFFDWVTCQN